MTGGGVAAMLRPVLQEPAMTNPAAPVLGLAVLGALLLALAACGGGGGDDGAASTGSSAATAEVQQARELAASGLFKRSGLAPVFSEPQVLGQMDQNLAGAVAPQWLANRYAATLGRLVQRAALAPPPAGVVSDLACTAVPFGGGVTADQLLVLDGKLLDMFADIANGLALRESARLSASVAQVVDAAAGLQLSFSRFCAASDPLAFPDAALTAAELERAVEIFTQLTGGIFFHEFGHVWGWHALLRLRDGLLSPGGGFFSYTSAIEDNADLTSGILGAKAGHDLAFAQMAYDLMAFVYFYRQAPGSLSFADTQTWNAQYGRTSPTYSSLAARKQLLGLGAAAWELR